MQRWTNQLNLDEIRQNAKHSFCFSPKRTCGKKLIDGNYTYIAGWLLRLVARLSLFSGVNLHSFFSLLLLLLALCALYAL